MFKKIKDFFVGEKYEGFVFCPKCHYFWHTTKPEINISFKDLPRFSKGIDGLCQKCKIKQEETNEKKKRKTNWNETVAGEQRYDSSK